MKKITKITKLLMGISLFSVILTSCNLDDVESNSITDSGVIIKYNGPKKYTILTDNYGDVYSAITNASISETDVGKRVRLIFKVLSVSGPVKNVEISMMGTVPLKLCVLQSDINNMSETEKETFEATLGTTGMKHNIMNYEGGFLNFDIITLSNNNYPVGKATLIYDDLKSAETGIQEFYLHYNATGNASNYVSEYFSFYTPDIFNGTDDTTVQITYRNLSEPEQTATYEVVRFKISNTPGLE